MRQCSITLCSLVVFALAVWVGCSSGPAANQVPASAIGILPQRHRHVTRADDPGAYIKHIFIIVQENRSLNNLFAGSGISGAGTTMYGCASPPFKGSGSGYYGSGSGYSCPTGDKVVKLHPVALATAGGNGWSDIDHCYLDAVDAIDGSAEPMDGFNHEYPDEECPSKGDEGGAGTVPYAYVDKSHIGEYVYIANNWVLGANFYPTELGPSFVAHQNLIAGTTEIAKNTAVANYPPYSPWGCDYSPPPPNKMQWISPTRTPGPTAPPTPCYTEYHTIVDELDSPPNTNGAALPPSPIPWRYYAPTYGQGGYIWSAFDAINSVRNGPDWDKDVKPYSPSWHVLEDISSGALGTAGVVWVVPNSDYSDHAGEEIGDEGPAWVGDVVNAIGTSSLWSSSVIVILWDDWGGWYDNAPPPKLGFQSSGYTSGALRGEGIRTPLLILSPYAKQGQDDGHVSLRYFNPGSILKFIEETFGLLPLGDLACDPSYGSGYGSGSGSECDRGYTDATANSIDYVFDWTQSPRPFSPVPVPSQYGDQFFEHGCGSEESTSRSRGSASKGSVSRPGYRCQYGSGGSGSGSGYSEYPPDDE
jgi:phospholipase C